MSFSPININSGHSLCGLYGICDTTPCISLWCRSVYQQLTSFQLMASSPFSPVSTRVSTSDSFHQASGNPFGFTIYTSSYPTISHTQVVFGFKVIRCLRRSFVGPFSLIPQDLFRAHNRPGLRSVWGSSFRSKFSNLFVCNSNYHVFSSWQNLVSWGVEYYKRSQRLIYPKKYSQHSYIRHLTLLNPGQLLYRRGRIQALSTTSTHLQLEIRPNVTWRLILVKANGHGTLRGSTVHD